MHTKNYDIIFTGGGAACRILLYFLSEKKEFNSLQILVIEAANTTNEKTWCYWNTATNPFQQLACKEWSHLQFEADKISNKQYIQPFTYSCINGSDFNTFFNEQFFSKHKNITISTELVIAVNKSANDYLVKTTSGTYKAPLIFNSIPGLQNTGTKTNMWQHFEGWLIQTEHPCFEDEVASLMNFNDYSGGPFSFLYILPFAKNKALIEYTFYSGDLYPSAVYEERIKQYLAEKKITAYTIIKKEKGKIPLHPDKKIKADAVGMIDIGSAGGLVKPSTGYAFQRMIEDCRSIADSFHTPQMIRRRKRPGRFLFYDALLLRIIHEDPARAVSIFKQLFRKQPMQRILTFLNEDSSLLDELRIFVSLPWAPFLRRIKFFK